VSAAILCEIDYLLRARLRTDAALHFLSDLADELFALEAFTSADLVRSRTILEQYAAVMATADRLGISRILTVDERHFRAVRNIKGVAFYLLPADA
jgi:hypothetical protein